MRLLVAASIAFALVTGSACEQCSCASTKRSINVLLTEADASSVISVGFNQTIGVELPGSGRTITVSDSKRLRSETPAVQPTGKTLWLFSAVGTATVPSQLETFGGTEMLSAPAQGHDRAWQVTLIVDSTIIGLGVWANVVTLGEDWVYQWPVGGRPPMSSNTQIVGPSGPPLQVTTAILDWPSGAITVTGTVEQQMFYAVAPGKAFLMDPFNRPLATNETLETYEVIVSANTGWSCSVATGCAQTFVGASQWPDHAYGYGETPPP